jgi:hypothetical protein
MLMPLVAGQWHITVMIATAAIMLSERLAPPERPRWRLSASLRPLAFIPQHSVVRHG